MIIRSARGAVAPTRVAGTPTGSRFARQRLPLLVAAGATAAALLTGCSNGLDVSGPSQSDTPVTTPASGTPMPTDSASSSVASTGPANDGTSASPTAAPSRPGSSSSDATSSAATAGTGTSTADRRAGTPRPTCRLGDLKVGVRTPKGAGTAGSLYVLIDFTNTSAKSCWLYGYSGVSFVGHHNGTQLGHPAVRDGSTVPHRVRLDPQQKTSELLRIVNASNYPAAQCAPTTADGFRIYPPASTAAAFVPYKTQACQSNSKSQLTVFPVGTKR